MNRFWPKFRPEFARPAQRLRRRRRREEALVALAYSWPSYVITADTCRRSVVVFVFVFVVVLAQLGRRTLCRCRLEQTNIRPQERANRCQANNTRRSALSFARQDHLIVIVIVIVAIVLCCFLAACSLNAGWQTSCPSTPTMTTPGAGPASGQWKRRPTLIHHQSFLLPLPLPLLSLSLSRIRRSGEPKSRV